ncbi:MAG: calcium-binding protein [Byssovorax sp.]
MRTFLPIVLFPLAMAGAGCGAEVTSGSSTDTTVDPTEACQDAHARFKACGADPSQTPYDEYLGPCNSACIADCLAAAPCADLAPRTQEEIDELQGCPPSDTTGNCVTDCLNGCYTPLVLSFDAAPVRFLRSQGTFDFGTGAPINTDWPTAETPWLALDRNGNGMIDDAGELFGSATELRSGGRGPNGFIPLAELDSNGDGHITSADDAWASLLLWSDRDGDHKSSAGELVPLSRTGILSLDLAYGLKPRCDARGNCEVERSRFRFQAAGAEVRQGALIDIHLRKQGNPALLQR